MSAFGGKADIIQRKADIKECPILTQSGHALVLTGVPFDGKGDTAYGRALASSVGRQSIRIRTEAFNDP